MNLIRLPHITITTVTGVICSLKGLFLAQKRCHALELINKCPGNKRNMADMRRKVRTGDSWKSTSMRSGQLKPSGDT